MSDPSARGPPFSQRRASWERKVNDLITADEADVRGKLTGFWAGLSELEPYAAVIAGTTTAAELRERTYLASVGLLYAIGWAATLPASRGSPQATSQGAWMAAITAAGVLGESARTPWASYWRPRLAVGQEQRAGLAALDQAQGSGSGGAFPQFRGKVFVRAVSRYKQ